MNDEYNDSRPSDDRDAVVTYTRIPGPRRPKRPARERAERAPDPVLDAAEIRRVDVDEPLGGDSPVVEPRSDGAADIEDFVADRRRPDWARYGLVAASLAGVVGAGILAVTVGFATMLPGGTAEDEGSGVPALALDSAERDSEVATAPADVREIPMPSGPSEAAMDTEITPAPVPRPRPNDIAARTEPDATAPRAASASQSDRSPESQPAASPESQPAPSDVAASPEPAPAARENAGSDSLITSIEETLARVDEEAPAGAGGEQAAEPQTASPPQSTSPAVPAAPPPVEMTQPNYPRPGEVVPPPAGPNDDILPPPAAMGGYSAGPVPPEPVPEAYPQALPVYPDDQTYPQNPNVYPGDPYVISPETAEETDARRPGFLRRTLAKATDVVERIFTRN